MSLHRSWRSELMGASQRGLPRKSPLNEMLRHLFSSLLFYLWKIRETITLSFLLELLCYVYKALWRSQVLSFLASFILKNIYWGLVGSQCCSQCHESNVFGFIFKWYFKKKKKKKSRPGNRCLPDFFAFLYQIGIWKGKRAVPFCCQSWPSGSKWMFTMKLQFSSIQRFLNNK